MRVFNLAEELEKERKKNKELENEKRELNYLIGGLSRENKEKQDIIINLVKRIDRAIEYIEKESWFMYKDNELVIDRTPIEKLLNILKGSDKE